MYMANVNLNIMCWNATGIMSSASYLCNSLNDKHIDICGISEHWLYEKNLNFLEQIDTNYKSHAVSDAALRLPGRRRVGKGGVALLWHRKHSKHITPITYDDDRIIGIRYEINSDACLYIFQIYLPCSNHSVPIFQDYIDRLNNILNLYSGKGVVIIMGDLNANILSNKFSRNLNIRSQHLLKVLADNNMMSANTLQLCTGASSSYVSYDGSSESLIDHILFPVDNTDLVSRCEICDDDTLNVSRHRPVVCQVNIPISQPSPPDTSVDTRINWKRADDQSIDAYRLSLSSSSNLQNVLNKDINSRHLIDETYNVIIHEIKNTAKIIFPTKKFKSYLKPYWNTELSSLHKDMKTKRRSWLEDGKPRNCNNASYLAYKTAKREFRRKHRQASVIYIRTKMEEIDKLAEVDSTLFWRHVNSRRKKSNNSVGVQLNFNGKIISSSKEITNEWSKYFKQLYSPTEYRTNDNSFHNSISNSVRNINRFASNDFLECEYPSITLDEVQS